MYTISNKVTRLARLPQTMRLIRSIKALSEEAEGSRHKNILLAAYNVVKVPARPGAECLLSCQGLQVFRLCS